MIAFDCFILCNVVMHCFMMCNELHKCMHHARNLPIEASKNARCVSPTFTSCGSVWAESSYLKFAQKLTNISPYIDSKYMINNNIIIITLYLYICLVRFLR
nr:hypothetical protein K2ALPHA62_LOCUS55 [Klebsiella phage vB_Kpn_K2alpha62]